MISAQDKLSTIELDIMARLNLKSDPHKTVCRLYRFAKDPQHHLLMADHQVGEWMKANYERQLEVLQELKFGK